MSDRSVFPKTRQSVWKAEDLGNNTRAAPVLKLPQRTCRAPVSKPSIEEKYGCVEELLRQPNTQRALSRHEQATEELDSSVRLLDICGTARD